MEKALAKDTGKEGGEAHSQCSMSNYWYTGLLIICDNANRIKSKNI